MKVVLIHLALDTRTGDYLRIRKIRADVSRALNTLVKEIVLVKPWKIKHAYAMRKSCQDSVQMPLFLPLIFPFRNYSFIRVINDILIQLWGYCVGLLIRPDIVIGETHNSWMFLLGIYRWSKKCKIAIDLHGAAAEEAEYRYSWSKSHWSETRLRQFIKYLNKLENNVLLRADLLIVPSNDMTSHLEEKHDLKVKRSCVYPCGVDVSLFKQDPEVRKQTRRNLGIRDSDIVFIYCGGFHQWQMIEEMFGIVGTFVRKFKISIRMLVLTQESEKKVLNMATKSGIDTSHMLVRSVTNSEVPAYINAADIGFLLREDTVLNRVASPTKLAEYLSCGIPVITGSVSQKWGWIKDKECLLCVVNLKDQEESAFAVHDYINHYFSNRSDISRQAVEVAQMRLSSHLGFHEIQKAMVHILNA